MNARWLICLLLCAAACPAAAAADWGPITIANRDIAPGEKRRFTFDGERSFEGAFIDVAVFAARGVRSGPTLCVTSAIHGDEVNSVEIARRVFEGVDARQL